MKATITFSLQSFEEEFSLLTKIKVPTPIIRNIIINRAQYLLFLSI